MLHVGILQCSHTWHSTSSVTAVTKDDAAHMSVSMGTPVKHHLPIVWCHEPSAKQSGKHDCLTPLPNKLSHFHTSLCGFHPAKVGRCEAAAGWSTSIGRQAILRSNTIMHAPNN